MTGDITALRCDAIVNSTNSRMIGCYIPRIHTYSGIQFRLACFTCRLP